MAELYPVNETFLSWQGEGVHLGRKAFFIRLQGCPVKCAWCDSASTWHPQFVPKQVRKASAAELAEEAAAARPEFVVLTGGEPCIHDLTALLAAMASIGLKVHLETCGAYPIVQGFAWVTVSPKVAMPGGRILLKDAMERANEIKMPVASEEDIAVLLSQLSDLPGSGKDKLIWLQPVDATPRATEICIAAAKNNPGFRVSFQVHKYVGLR
jgi:putative 7-cyano-7-deazaguanosine (preQ0) biosynthesis protein QueE